MSLLILFHMQDAVKQYLVCALEIIFIFNFFSVVMWQTYFGSSFLFHIISIFANPNEDLETGEISKVS